MEGNRKNVKERLEILLVHLDITQKEFSQLTGISENTLSNAKKGKNIPVLDFFNAIYKAVPNLNPTWLYMGVGEMLSNPEGINSAIKHIHDIGERMLSKGRKWLGEKECNEELEKADREIEHLKNELNDKKDIIRLLKDEKESEEDQKLFGTE